MKFSSHSASPSPPRDTIPFPADAPSGPTSQLAALIPGFLRRPTQSLTRPRSSRSRSSSIVATIASTTSANTSYDSAASTCTSSRPSSEDMGLLDDDPFACPWELPRPIHSLPTSPLASPTREKFLPLDTLGHAVGQSLRFPSLNNENGRIDEDEEETDILPLHRRDRSYTLKAHPRNATWKSDKPAFRDRPSLPPLSILAQQTIVVVAPKSSRARHFPSEPWDKDISELPALPRAKSLSPVAQQRAEPPRRLSELNGDKQLPPLPRAGDGLLHPSPIAEVDESGRATEYGDDEFDEEDVFEYEECSAPPSSPDYSFLEDLEEEEEEEEQDDLLDQTPLSGVDAGKPQVSRETLTASVAIAFSLVQESHGDMLRPPSQRPNTLSTSPAPSSCLLPSPNILPLPELIPRASSSVTSGDTDGSVQREQDGMDTFASYWRNESQQISSSSSTAPLPCPAHRHRSWDLNIQAPPHVTTITSSSFSSNLDTLFHLLLRKTRRRALSFSFGDENPYNLNTNTHMATTSGRAQSYGGYSRHGQDGLAGRHSSHGANGAGRDGGRGDRDLFGRKSLDAGTAGDDRRRRVPYQNSSALDDDEDEDDEDDSARYGAPERSAGRRGSESLRVPRQPSSRPSSSRSSGSKLPPVPPLPSQYQSAASPSPRISPTHSRNHSGNHPPSAFIAPQHHPAPATNPPTPSRPTFPRSASHNKTVTSTESTSSDSDDVPLAQRIPTALTAQKSIRKKARDERDRYAVRGRQTGLGLNNVTVPPDELASKLLHVQQNGGERGRSMGSSATVSRSASRHHTHGHPSPNMRRLEEQLQSYQISGDAKPLQHARSVKRAEDEEYTASRPIPRPRLRSLGPSSDRTPVPDAALHRMPSSRSRPVSPDRYHPPPQSSMPTSRDPSGRSLSHAPSTSRTRSRANTVAASDRSNHADDHLRRARTVRDPHGQENKMHHPPMLAPTPQPARVSSDHPAAPPPPASPMKQAFADTEQLRVFIGDLQRFVNVEITSTTTADDVLEMVSSQGELSGRDWMLWELANEFGMERPIRDYERLSDVFTSWNKESRLNALMLKQTPLAISLSRKYLPNSSPTFSGYVQWEVKKGKWQKRWLELREHSLFLCKKDNGKDAAFLCSLSSFDAYVVKRVTKAPKPFVFAVKSTESISMFENPADCVHVFCCDSDEGKDWLEKILLARSYVLYQERNVLFRTQRAVGNSNSAGAGVQRSNTRRNPHQPLIPDVSPSLPALPFQQSSNQSSRTAHGANVFAEGSLLSRPTPQF